MSKLGAVFLTGFVLAAAPVAAFAAPPEVPHHVSHAAAWGCRDKGEVFDLLFQGLSASFDDKLADALASGRCVYFRPGEDVTILEDGGHGLVKVVRRGGAEPVAYWTPQRNLN